MKNHALPLALLALAALGLASCRSSLSSLTATNDTVNIIAFNGQRHAVNTAQCIPYDDAPEYDFFCTWPGERNIGEFSHEVYLYTKTRLTPGTYTFADSNIEDLDSAAAHGKVEAFVSLDSDHRSSRLVGGQLTVTPSGDHLRLHLDGTSQAGDHVLLLYDRPIPEPTDMGQGLFTYEDTTYRTDAVFRLRKTRLNVTFLDFADTRLGSGFQFVVAFRGPAIEPGTYPLGTLAQVFRRRVHCFVNPCGLPVSSVSGHLTVARDGDRYTFTATGLDNYSAPFRFTYTGLIDPPQEK